MIHGVLGEAGRSSLGIFGGFEEFEGFGDFRRIWQSRTNEDGQLPTQLFHLVMYLLLHTGMCIERCSLDCFESRIEHSLISLLDHLPLPTLSFSHVGIFTQYEALQSRVGV